MIGVPINEPLPAWRYWLVRPWLKFWTSLFLRAGLGFWPRFTGWENYRKAQDARCHIAPPDTPQSLHFLTKQEGPAAPAGHPSSALSLCLRSEASQEPRVGAPLPPRPWRSWL